MSLAGRRATAGVANARRVGRNGNGQSQEERAAGAVKAAIIAKVALEEKVGQLRARLAHERALALERRAEAGEMVEEVRRLEAERVRFVKRLRRQGEAPVATVGDGKGGAWSESPPRGEVVVPQQVVEEGPDGRGLAELTVEEAEVFGRLQAETVEMRQREAEAEKAEEEERAAATRKAAETRAALEEALVDGRRLKSEAEQLEVGGGVCCSAGRKGSVRSVYRTTC